MASFRDTILPALDNIRGIMGQATIGLRPFTVTKKVRVWNLGTRPGLGGATNYTDTNTVFTNLVNGTAVNVKVQQVSRAEAIASGGLYTNRDMKVGPITPTSSQYSGGFTDSQVDPEQGTQTVEIFWQITGPGYPAAGQWFDKVGEEATPMHYYVYLRATGKRP